MKKLLFVFAGLAFALTAAAQEFRITHGPYLCDMSQDGVTVVWTTSRPALSWVEASPADSLAPAPPPRHYQTVAGRKLFVSGDCNPGPTTVTGSFRRRFCRGPTSTTSPMERLSAPMRHGAGPTGSAPFRLRVLDARSSC